MQYSVVSQNNSRFEVTNERGQAIGLLQCSIWMPNSARITVGDNNIYEIASSGFWQMKRSVTRNGIPYALISPRPARGIVLSFEDGRSYLLQKKTFWSNGEYFLTDEAGNEVAAINSYFRWRIFGFQYEIGVNEHLLDTDTMNIIPFILIYCVRYMRRRRAVT